MGQKEGVCKATLKYSVGKTKKDTIECTITDNASKTEKIKWLYNKVIEEHLGFKGIAENVSSRADIVEKIDITKDSARFTVNICLTKEEKARRVKKLVEAITTVRRATEARTEVLHPDFIAWSIDLPTVLLHNVIEKIVTIDGNGHIIGIDNDKLKNIRGRKKESKIRW